LILSVCKQGFTKDLERSQKKGGFWDFGIEEFSGYFEKHEVETLRKMLL